MSRANGKTLLSRAEIDALKASVDLAEVIRAAGVELKAQGKNFFGRCPFHEDDKPSLSVNPEAQLWQCFGCRAGGDVFKFLELSEKLDFPGQLARLQALTGQLSDKCPRPERPPRIAELPGGYTRGELLERVAQLYATRFRETTRGREYLAARGLTDPALGETFQLGLADGSLRSLLAESGPLREALQAIGVLNGKGQEHFHGCLVLPLTHPDEGVVGLYGRHLEHEGQRRHRLLPGPMRGLLNWQTLRSSKRLVLVEGVLDALSFWQAGVRDVSCLFGCNLPPDLERLLGGSAVREVVLALDGDPAGRENAERLAEVLTGRGLAVRRAELPDGLDPNALFLGQGPAALNALLPTAPPVIEAPTSERQDGFDLVQGEVTYQVTMLPPFGGRLRAKLRALRGDRLHVDKLDLESHRARHVLMVQLVRRLDLSRPEAECHLTSLMRVADEWVKSRDEAAKLPDGPPELTGDERREAMAFLTDPNLLERVLEDMEALGSVGEETGKLLVYLIGISRKLEKPLSGIIRSQSGSGKSSLAELAERLTPPEDVRFYSRISPTALTWGPTDLQHKLLILEERAGGEGADYSIRTLQSRRKLSQLVTTKDENGQMSADFREVLGPIAFLETTTQAELNAENTTRCFEIFLDESEEQTRRIQEAQRQARRPQRLDPGRQAEAIYRKHHNAQRLLDQVPVFISYVEHLEFPTRWLRTRRDHERFLTLVEASALLHQHQRQRGQTEDGTAYVLSDLADYRTAYSLIRRVLEATFHELSQTARELWDVARGYALERSSANPADVVFTRRDLRHACALQDHVLRTALAELVEMEYLTVVAGSNGKAFHYRLAVLEESSLTPLAALTTPDQLEAALRR